MPICTYAYILIFMYMYRNNVHKCIHTRPTNMQSYKINIIIFEVCSYYLLHIIKKGIDIIIQIQLLITCSYIKYQAKNM